MQGEKKKERTKEKNVAGRRKSNTYFEVVTV